ncbi:hypothetical protein COV18_01415 [Candidatus Woesearchaeota archaeon CG10_big_fil_rev_8_21_14_0_10_37_12]|nr:MAG: hypothetical protein COV18_01415 [Candidatus Woesearchaeota archaeon CG10_big_fil_rev_8_21_14_0_10_37_12]
MNTENVLKDLGLSDGETKVYLALLKIGTSTVAQLKEESRLHRTTIYDFIEKLLNKGLVSYVIKGGVKYFSAAPPKQLFDLLKEKQENLQTVLPELTKLANFEKPDVKVEVYKGTDGFKTVANDMLRRKGELLSIGIDESKFKERFPYIMEQIFKKEQELGMTERNLAAKGTQFIYPYPNLHYKYMPKEFFSPTPMIIYDNKIGIFLWEANTQLLIENKELANAWKKYFEYFWKKADKTA